MPIHRIIVIVNLALITLITYLGVSFCYDLVGGRFLDTPQQNAAAASPVTQATAENHPLAYYAPIIDRDLFQTRATPQPQVQDQALDIDALEETQLKLKLWGTVSGSPTSAYAVIEDTQKREQNLYRVGDVIQNATLKAILREKVVLALMGVDQVLSMEKVVGAAGGPVAVPRPTAPSTPSEEPQAPESETANRAQRVSLSRSMIDSAMQDVSKLMTEITITPNVNENGQQSGLALQNIQPNSIFRRMGLRNGDVLVGVDGQEIESVDDAMSLYENLKSASQVQVQILRRGQERTIEYNIR